MVTQEIVIVYWDDAKHPTHVVIQNGSTEFYKLTKIRREALSDLLGASKVSED